MSSFDSVLARTSSLAQLSVTKNESLSQRNVPSHIGRTLNDQNFSLNLPSPLNVGTSPSTNTFTTRNITTGFKETNTAKQILEQSSSQQTSAFHRTATGQTETGYNQQRSFQNGTSNVYQQQLSNPMKSRALNQSDSHSCMSLLILWII